MGTEKTNKTVSLKKLLPYIWEEKALFFGGFFAMIFVSGARLVHPLIIAHIIDVSVPSNDTGDLYLWAAIFIGVIILMGFANYLQIILLAKLGIKIVTKIKANVFDHLLKLPVSYFDKNPVGELIARVESDSENVKQLFSNLSVMLIGNVLFFIGMLSVLIWKNWQITAYLMIPIPFMLTLAILAIRYFKKYFKKIREMYAEISAIMTEYIQGIEVVQLFNQEDRVKRILDKKSFAKRMTESKVNFMEYGLWGVQGLFTETLFIILVILLTAPKVLQGAVTIGTLVIFIQYGNELFYPLMAISENINFLQRAFVSMQRIYNILAIPTESDLKKRTLKPSFNKTIEFRNVWFKYKEDEWVLKDINFSIKKGEKIALVGASGSGKTTSVNLICGFYNVNKGEILVDGQNLNEFHLHDWRKRIGLVLQDVYLFPGNILENVRIYNDEFSEEQVEEALKAVQAKEFISHTEGGIYMELKERGQNISMGEKQLISFARAIAFSPEIIIMDEATASVDAVTESKIQKAMEKLLKGKTAIIVAHRLTSVINADKILLFQNGKIIASGTHNQLLKFSTDYKKLFELQFLA